MHRVTLAESIAERWNDAGVTYAVAHGIDEYPARLGRDLDVVVRASDVPRAIAAARAVLEGSGLSVASPPPLWGERLVAAEPTAPDEMLEVHTITGITWRNAALVERIDPSARVGPFAVDPWVSVAKRVVLPLLTSRERVLASDPSRLTVTPAERRVAAAELARLAGPRLGASILAAIVAADVGALIALAPDLRRAVVRRSALTRPLRSSALLWRGAVRRLWLPLSPCAPVVDVVGGSDQETTALLRAIAEGDRLVFTDLLVRPRPRRRFGLTDLLRDRIDSGRQRLVLYGSPGDRPLGRASRRVESVIGRAMPWPTSPTPDLLLSIGGEADRAPVAAGGSRGGSGGGSGGPTYAVLPAGLDIEEMRRRAVALIIGAFIAKNRRNAPESPSA